MDNKLSEQLRHYRFFLLTLLVVAIDQTVKILVHRYMYLHEEVNVIGDWFRLHYLLNPGMAFGFRWENEFGKLGLTLFRIVAMVGIGYYILKTLKQNAKPGFLWCLALILGGAIGNVIDSTFYGVWFNNQPAGAATPWFHGQVIDMLYFPIFEFTWPDWIPGMGGQDFLFFSPVFNIADSAIFVGVVIILLMQRRFFRDTSTSSDQNASQEMSAEEAKSVRPDTLESASNPPTA